MRRDISLLAERIRAAKRLTVLTGAGVSAASGVPTFRGPNGLWRQFRPGDLATPHAFRRDPRLVWQWYAWRRETIARCEPNAAHRVLARWSQASDGVRVITQNVDGLHLRAGTRRLVRLHGSIWELSCWNRCADAPATWRDDRVPLPELPPMCPHCGGLARPAVVWFGESLAERDMAMAEESISCGLLAGGSQDPPYVPQEPPYVLQVFLSVGTSSMVYPAAGLVHRARLHGSFTAEINPDETAASGEVDLTIRARAEEVLPLIDDAIDVDDP